MPLDARRSKFYAARVQQDSFDGVKTVYSPRRKSQRDKAVSGKIFKAADGLFYPPMAIIRLYGLRCVLIVVNQTLHGSTRHALPENLVRWNPIGRGML